MSISSVKVQTAPVPGRQNEIVSHMRCRIGRGGGDRDGAGVDAAEFVKLAFEFLGPGGGARDDRDPGRLRPWGPTPGADPGTGTPRKSRPAGSRTSKPSGTTSRKYHSNKYIQLISKTSGAYPETGLSYPERPPPGSQDSRPPVHWAPRVSLPSRRGRSGFIFPCGKASSTRSCATTTAARCRQPATSRTTAPAPAGRGRPQDSSRGARCSPPAPSRRHVDTPGRPL